MQHIHYSKQGTRWQTEETKLLVEKVNSGTLFKDLAPIFERSSESLRSHYHTYKDFYTTATSKPPRKGSKWTPFDEQSLLEMVKKKMPWKKIAATFSRSITACVSKYDALKPDTLQEPIGDTSGENMTPMVTDKSHKQWLPTDRSRLIELGDQQQVWANIAAELGRKPYAVQLEYKRLKKLQNDPSAESQKVYSERVTTLKRTVRVSTKESSSKRTKVKDIDPHVKEAAQALLLLN